MNCEEAKQVLMDLALDEAQGDDRRQVEAHLASCAACRAELANLKVARKLLVQGLPQEEMPRRIAFVPAEPPSRTWAAWLWSRAFTIPVGAAAAIAVLACGLALAHARLVIEQGHWELAFGSRPAAAVPAATPAAPSAMQAIPAGPLTREQAQQLVAAAIRDSEQRQQAATVIQLRAAGVRLDARQQAVLANLTEQMRNFSETQTLLYKQNEGTRSLVANLMSREKGE